MIPLYKKKNSPFWFADLRSVGGGRVSTKRTNKREATKVADFERTKLLDREQLGVRDDMTIKEGLDRYIGELGEGGYKEDRERDRDKLLGLNKWKDKKIHQWSPRMLMADLTTVLVSDLQAKRRAEGLSNSSINSETKMLQRTYNLCLKEWGVVVQPGVVFRTYKVPEKMRRLSKDEEEALLAELNPMRLIKSMSTDPAHPRRLQMQDAYDLTIMLIDTGCRTDEAASVRWDQVSLQEETIEFFRTKVNNEGLVAMTPRVKKALVRRRSMYPGSRYVFPRWDYSKVNVRQPRSGCQGMGSISRAIARAGINDDPLTVKKYGKFTPHSFRDTFCSRIQERGVASIGAQQLMGHATNSMTKKYTHLESKDLARKAAELLAQ